MCCSAAVPRPVLSLAAGVLWPRLLNGLLGPQLLLLLLLLLQCPARCHNWWPGLCGPGCRLGCAPFLN